MNEVLTLNPAEIEKLEKIANFYGALIDYKKSGYILFSFKIDVLNFVVYKSGKTVIQGKDNFDLLNEVKLALFDNEVSDLSISGSDEAGKGDIFGPLVISAVYCDSEIDKKLKMIGVSDSKKFSDIKISKLSKQIFRIAPYSIMILKPEKYNELYSKMKNLNRLLAWAHHKVHSNLKDRNIKFDSFVIDDFGMKVKAKNWITNDLKAKLILETKAEEKYTAVAAASIISRQAMNEWFIEHPFPKGASNVDVISKKLMNIFHKDGFKGINKVAKVHFSPVKKVLNSN